MIEINKFIDIHTHILHGIDDGSGGLQESLEIAMGYQETGVKKIIATPHFLPGTAWATPKEKVLELVGSFQQILDRKKIDVQILAGMEIAFHNNLIQRIENGSVLPLADSGHFLIEPSFQGEQDSLLLCLRTLIKSGYKLILAHPERIEGLRAKTPIIEDLVGNGLLIQCNSGSLLGYFGKKAREAAIHYHERGCVHFVASDVHGTTKRTLISDREWSQLLDDKICKKMLINCIVNSKNLF